MLAKAGAAALEPRQLLCCRLASECAIAMRETAKPLDDLEVLSRVFEIASEERPPGIRCRLLQHREEAHGFVLLGK